MRLRGIIRSRVSENRHISMDIPQPSFIPRQPTFSPGGRERRPLKLSIFGLIAVILFLISIGSAAAVFLYHRALEGRIAEYNNRLVRAKNAFEIEFVDEVVVLARRIDAAKAVLASHRALTPVFGILEQETLGTVRFTNFEFSLGADGSGTISLEGEAVGFNALALQSDAFGGRKEFDNPIFEDVDLEDSGNILFSFSAGIRPGVLSYQSTLPPPPEPAVDDSAPEDVPAAAPVSGAPADDGADVPDLDLDLDLGDEL